MFEALKEAPYILDEALPEVGILGFRSHNVQLNLRPYVRPDDFWDVTFSALIAIKKAFNTDDIKIVYAEGVEFGKIRE